jgi:hypothetical protein
MKPPSNKNTRITAMTIPDPTVVISSDVASYYQLLNHQLKPHLMATLIKKYPPRRSWTIGLPPALLMKAIDA